MDSDAKQPEGSVIAVSQIVPPLKFSNVHE